MQNVISGKISSKSLLMDKKFYRNKGLNSPEVLHNNIRINRKLLVYMHARILAQQEGLLHQLLVFKSLLMVEILYFVVVVL